jgi:hypothetical protein
LTNKEAGTEILVLLSLEQSLELVSALKEESRNFNIISLFNKAAQKVKDKAERSDLISKAFNKIFIS